MHLKHSGGGRWQRALAARKRETVVQERVKLSGALVVAEYQAIRQEILQGMNASGWAARWTITSYGVLFGLGLVAMYQYQSSHPPEVRRMLDFIILAIFGIAVPGMNSVGAWLWLSEINRVERLSAQLRALEETVAAISGTTDLTGHEPVRRERYISRARNGGNKRFTKKQPTAYIATFCVFLGGQVMTVVVFTLWIVQISDRLSVKTIVLSSTALGVLVLAFLLVSISIAYRTSQLHAYTPDFDD